MPAPCITLTDNGSLRPEATFSLRRLSQELGDRIGEKVHAVSLMHSGRIDPDKLEGQPADTFEKFAATQREFGVNEFLVVPLFFGPSAAIAEYLPQRVDAMRDELDWPELNVRVAPCMVDLDAKEDFRVAEMLADLVRATRKNLTNPEPPSVALVDHGTPRITVTHVRNMLAEQLQTLLGEEVNCVRPCSMERREGSEYDYNEPLLENLLGTDGYTRQVIVSMLFLQPGRHAGEGGDVAEICEDAEKAHPGMSTNMTELVGKHPALIALLAERYEQGIPTEPVSWKALTAAHS